MKKFDEYLDYLTLTLKDGREVKGFCYQGRLPENYLPKGYNAYDLRESDDNDGTIAEISNRVIVNHFGVFITEETIDCNDGIEVLDWDFDPWEEEN